MAVIGCTVHAQHVFAETVVFIRGDDIHINGRPTHEGCICKGHRIEGLLFNNRVLNATFDDLNPETVAR